MKNNIKNKYYLAFSFVNLCIPKDLPSFVVLRGVYGYFFKDASEKRIGSIFKGQSAQEQCG
jgi:hypothetical protein